MKYTTRYQITASQIDAQYRLSIEGLLAFHENTVARYLTTLGCAAFDMQKQDKTWIISEINLDLPEPPTIWSEDIDITIWVSEMSAIRIWMEFEAREVHSGKTVARGNSCWSLISMSERRLVPCEGVIPAAEMEAGPATGEGPMAGSAPATGAGTASSAEGPMAGSAPRLAAGRHRKRGVMTFRPDPIGTLIHTVNHIDLDFNGHTNNRRYVQMALWCFEDEFQKTHRPDFLNIRFLRESLLGDEMTCRTFPTDDPATFVGVIQNPQGQEACRVSSHWREKEPQRDIAEENYLRG